MAGSESREGAEAGQEMSWRGGALLELASAVAVETRWIVAGGAAERVRSSRIARQHCRLDRIEPPSTRTSNAPIGRCRVGMSLAARASRGLVDQAVLEMRRIARDGRVRARSCNACRFTQNSGVVQNTIRPR